MENIIIVLIILIIVGFAGLYIYKAKKSGQKCIGCPHSGSCSSGNKGSGGCGCS